MSEEKPVSPGPSVKALESQPHTPEKEKEPDKFILVAEDSRPNRNILVQNFKKFGYGVCEFENGKKAWDYLTQKNDKNIVAVFSDIMMPEMDGLELLKNIRAHETFKTLPFILISAVTQKEFIIEAKKNKANGYLLKPLTSAAIKDKLKDMFPPPKT
ncbi:MAG: response regulator [Pseudomonadota bacterium]|nr:response regulator [Pseudomonadota bacterium]